MVGVHRGTRTRPWKVYLSQSALRTLNSDYRARQKRLQAKNIQQAAFPELRRALASEEIKDIKYGDGLYGMVIQHNLTSDIAFG